MNIYVTEWIREGPDELENRLNVRDGMGWDLHSWNLNDTDDGWSFIVIFVKRVQDS